MKNTTPQANFQRLGDMNAFKLGENVNDMNQRMEFFEDPTLGDEGFVWVSFPHFKVAFVSDFFDTNDMKGKVRDLYTEEEIKAINGNLDLDYVPRLVNNPESIEYDMKLKFDTL